MTVTTEIDRLNRRLGDHLGFVCGGSLPRFAWKYAPENPWLVYGRDNRTLIRKCWADQTVLGTAIGKVWLLAIWDAARTTDDHGFGTPCQECEGAGFTYWSGSPWSEGGRFACGACGGTGRIHGIRVPFIREAGYSPRFETALEPGQMPTAAITQNYIWALGKMLAESAECDPRSIENFMATGTYTAERNERREDHEFEELALSQYDDSTGAFGNCAPGTRGGFLSFGGV